MFKKLYIMYFCIAHSTITFASVRTCCFVFSWQPPEDKRRLFKLQCNSSLQNSCKIVHLGECVFFCVSFVSQSETNSAPSDPMGPGLSGSGSDFS